MLLIQTHEAHSSAWPVGLPNQPEPHRDFAARVQRAHEFVAANAPPFDVYVDGWDDAYEQRFRAWPDQYYFVDASMRVLFKSEYGARADALIDYDCLHLLRDIFDGTAPLDGIDLARIKDLSLQVEAEEEAREQAREEAGEQAVAGACAI